MTNATTATPEIIRLVGCYRLKYGAMQIDFTEDEFKSLMSTVLNSMWGMENQTNATARSEWVSDVRTYLARRPEQAVAE